MKLKEHVALDRSTWSLKIVCNRLLYMHMIRKIFFKVKYNDPHKYHSKLRGFPFTSSTRSIVNFMGVKFLTSINGRPC